MALSIEDLLAVEDRPVTTVRVESWNADVTVRLMTGVERDALGAMNEQKTKPTLKEMRRALFARTLCDADGLRLKPDVIEKLLEKSGVALEQLWQAVADMNGLSVESRQRLLGKPEQNSNEETNSSG